MVIGSLGDIIFSVSSEKIETLSDLKYTESVNFSEHKRHNTASILEYTGRNSAEMSFKITLSYLLGVNVEDEIKKIAEYTQQGKLLKLIIGKTVYGSYRWVITKYTVNYKYFDKYGDIVNADISLNLKEYCK